MDELIEDLYNAYYGTKTGIGVYHFHISPLNDYMVLLTKGSYYGRDRLTGLPYLYNKEWLVSLEDYFYNKARE